MTQQKALVALAEITLEWLESIYRDERLAAEDRLAACLLVSEYAGMFYDSSRIRRQRLLADLLVRPAEWLAAISHELQEKLIR